MNAVGLRQPHQHIFGAIIPGIVATNRAIRAERDVFPEPGKRPHYGMAIVNTALAIWAGKHVVHDLAPSLSSSGSSAGKAFYGSAPDSRVSYIV